MSNKALILFSGGQDSATCLAWALEKFDYVETIGFDYGQNHSIELEIRQQFLGRIHSKFPLWANKLGADHVIDLNVLASISDTALTSERELMFDKNGLPNTFVPGRNILFLTFAATVGFRRGITQLVGGMCETDFSGYPDCRNDTLKALQSTLSLGMGYEYFIHTPLMWITKAQTWEMALSLGGETLLNFIIEDTHTCYKGDRSRQHSWGYGCSNCPACELRRHGYLEFQKTKSDSMEINN